MEPGSGFYLEDTVSTAVDQVANGAANGASRGLFVAIEGSTAVAAGQHVAVDGRVAETGSARDTLTALVDATVTATCAEALALPLTEVSLPLDSRQREALESVRVAFAGDLVLLRREDAFAALEQPAPDGWVVRRLGGRAEADAFLKDRLAQYERMWDGCGCRIDYFG